MTLLGTKARGLPASRIRALVKEYGMGDFRKFRAARAVLPFVLLLLSGLYTVLPAYDLEEIDDHQYPDPNTAAILLGWTDANADGKSDMPIYWSIADGNTPTSSLDTAAFYNIVRNSFAAWQAPATSYVSFAPSTLYSPATAGVYTLTDPNNLSQYHADPTSGTAPPGGDLGLNMVICIDSGFSTHFKDAALAVTQYAWNISTRRIAGGDIFFNCEDYNWSDDRTPGTFDIQNALTHEIGHLIGLAHPPAIDERYESTMYYTASAGDINKRTLEQDDINGINYLYPEDSYPNSSQVPPDRNRIGLIHYWTGPAGGGGGGGGCTVATASSGDTTGFLLLLFGPVLLLLLKRSFRRPRAGLSPSVSVLVIAFCLLSSTRARASIVMRLNLMELTLRADSIVHGTVDSAFSHPGRRCGIVTDVTLVVHDPIKGKAGPTVRFTCLGGRIGDMAVTVVGAPGFTVGEEVVVFLGPGPSPGVIGLAQGKFSVRSSENGPLAVQDTRGLCLLDVRPPSPLEEGGPSTRWRDKAMALSPGYKASGGTIQALPLSELKKSIRSFMPGD